MSEKLNVNTKKSLTCPSCKNTVFDKDEVCEICKFPLKGTDKEKAVFIGQKYAHKQKKSDAKQAIKRNQIMLFILSGVLVTQGLVLLATNVFNLVNTIMSFIVGGFFIGMAFLVKAKPLLALIASLGFFLLDIILTSIIQSGSLFNGFIIKAIIFAFLSLGIYKVYQAKDVNK